MLCQDARQDMSIDLKQLFRLTCDPVQKAKWIKNLHRKQVIDAYVLNKTSQVCSLHFLQKDLTYESMDSKVSCIKVRKGQLSILSIDQVCIQEFMTICQLIEILGQI